MKSVAKGGKRAEPPASGGEPVKVIRDSFTMPVGDYCLIAELKNKCITLGVAVKKSELLRAGLKALTQMSNDELLLVISTVENLKTGRPPGKRMKIATPRQRNSKQ